MKRSLALAVTIVALAAGSALAAPGDPRVIQGVLEWPQTVSAEPFVVVRGEDGRLYYADISAAQRRGIGTLTVGSRVAMLGVEGSRPYEVAVLVIGSGDAASLGLTAPAAGSTPSASVTSTAPSMGAPGEPMWRLHGSVQSVAGGMVTLQTGDGQAHTVDASQLSTATLRALRPGDRVTLFGMPRSDDKLIANGYIQSEPAQPSASPPSR